MVAPALRSFSVREGSVFGRTRALTATPRLINAIAISWPRPPVAPATATKGEVMVVALVD